MNISSPVKGYMFDTDVDIKISAGRFGFDVGLFVWIDIVNYRDENVTVFCNKTWDFLILNEFDGFDSSEYIVYPFEKFWIRIGVGGLLVRYSITVECGNASVTRNGICIGYLNILYD
jgi:hypothetical protein